VGRLEEAVREPRWQAFLVLGLVIAAAWAGMWYLSGRLQARGAASAHVPGEPSITQA